MVSDDLRALGVHQTRVLTAVLSDLGAPLAVTLSSINDDASTFSLQSTERSNLNLARLRMLACDLADGLGVYRVDIVPSDDPTAVELDAHRYHARKRTSASFAGDSSMSMADVELLVARFLIERHCNTSPSWLACQLRVSWKAAERILAELDDDHVPAAR
ncbi:hypothetical protein [Sphingomonas sp.]|uniref:hypothetical protein n=1 Tax=Sphingomonas sp. TaxID=28214 RepID=UPI0035C868DB